MSNYNFRTKYIQTIYNWRLENNILDSIYFSDFTISDLCELDKILSNTNFPKDIFMLNTDYHKTDYNLLKNYHSNNKALPNSDIIYHIFFGISKKFTITTYITQVILSSLVYIHYHDLQYCISMIIGGFILTTIFAYLQSMFQCEMLIQKNIKIYLNIVDYFKQLLSTTQRITEFSTISDLQYVLNELQIESNLINQFLEVYNTSSKSQCKQIDLYFKDVHQILQNDKNKNLNLDYTIIKESIRDYMIKIITITNDNERELEQWKLEALSNYIQNETI